MAEPKYKRILLKLSGEALAGKGKLSIDPARIRGLCRQIVEVRNMDVQVALVVGGGNIFRGLAASKNGIDRVTGDSMGMLATVMNGLALQNTIESLGVETRVLSAIRMDQIAEVFIKRRAMRHLNKGRIIILVAGTGSPFFTTDTAAALRASEIEADVLLKATRVNGVYSDDPEKDAGAVMYPELTFMDVLKNDLKVMDATAISLARENNIPIQVFNILVDGNLKRVVTGEKIGTLVSAPVA